MPDYSRLAVINTIVERGLIKAIFCKQRDPAGNKVHLLYQAIA